MKDIYFHCLRIARIRFDVLSQERAYIPFPFHRWAGKYIAWKHHYSDPTVFDICRISPSIPNHFSKR